MQIKQKLLLLLVGALSVSAVTAQDETIRVETDLVTVNVALADEQGKAVKGLRREQFEIFDNQTKQQISYFSTEDAGISFGVVYDMHPTTDLRTAAVLNSLRTFAKNLAVNDGFFINAFNERGNAGFDFVPTIEQIQNNLPAGTKRREPNSLYDVIYLTADKLRAGKNLKRTLLIVTDSADHHSRRSFAELSRELKTFDVQVYAVIFDRAEMWTYRDVTGSSGAEKRQRLSGDATELDRGALGELTMSSGGAAYFPASQSEPGLSLIYRQIAQEMRECYTLSFYPSQPADGNRHNLKIALRGVENSKRFALTYRQGYQSPPSRSLKK